MALHQVSGRWRLGLALTLFTLTMWGGLALILKITAEQMSPLNISWYRFTFAFVVLLAFTQRRRMLTKKYVGGLFKGKAKYLLLGSTLGLSINYIFYVLGAATISASSIQVVMQLSMVFFTLGAIFVFREKFSRRQWLGLGGLVLGLNLFFGNKVVNLITNIDELAVGIAYGVVSSLTWALYAMTQKQLLNHAPSVLIMLFIFGGGSLIMLPFASPSSILSMNGLHLGLLILSALSTVLGYSALAEAVHHLEASKVSGILAVTPLATILTVETVAFFRPDLAQTEGLTIVGIIGAVLVVVGSTFATITPRAKSLL